MIQQYVLQDGMWHDKKLETVRQWTMATDIGANGTGMKM